MLDRKINYFMSKISEDGILDIIKIFVFFSLKKCCNNRNKSQSDGAVTNETIFLTRTSARKIKIDGFADQCEKKRSKLSDFNLDNHFRHLRTSLFFSNGWSTKIV